MCQGPQRSDAGEARIRGPSVSSQTLYHCATALPKPARLSGLCPRKTSIYPRRVLQVGGTEEERDVSGRGSGRLGFCGDSRFYLHVVVQYASVKNAYLYSC